MVESPPKEGTGMSLLEKIVKLCTGDYTRLEIWSDTDLGANGLKPYIRYIKRQLQEDHPKLHVLSTYKTPFLKDFEDESIVSLLYGHFYGGHSYGYVIKVSPNVDPYALKRTCMKLELDGWGNRRADIDVYSPVNLEASPRTGKISRKHLNRKRRAP